MEGNIFTMMQLTGLNFKIYKWLIQQQQQTTTVKKWADDLSRYFSKEAYRWPTGREKMLNITIENTGHLQ